MTGLTGYELPHWLWLSCLATTKLTGYGWPDWLCVVFCLAMNELTGYELIDWLWLARLAMILFDWLWNFLLAMNSLTGYTPTKKYPGSRDFLRQISTVFGNFLKKYLRYREVIYLIGKPSFSAFRRSKDIRCGYPHKIATPLWMKVELFSLKRAWRISRSGHALCL